MRNGSEKTPSHRTVLLVLLVLLIPVAGLLGWLLGRGVTPTAELKDVDVIPDHGHGLFSWHDEVFEQEEREILLRLMREQGLTELYQDIPFSHSTDEIQELLEACTAEGIRLYLLVGEPEWALDTSAKELRAEIQRAALIGCAGIMVDIEPGSTNKWKKDRDSAMDSMMKSLLRAKAAAELEKLEMIVCLSWYYDDYGYAAQLDHIVSEGCDALAIMNYDRTDEIGQIETEAALCLKYGRPLINIYELQEVGKYDLEEIHTYRDAGLPALRESWDELRSAYSDQEISAALHEYRALKAMS